MNILVIPEDFRKDQYILKPLFNRLLRNIGRRQAHVRVCLDPLLGGVTEATKSERLSEIFDVLVDQRGLRDHPGGGRKPLAEEAARRIDAIRHKCREDFDALAQRIEATIEAQ